MENRNGEDELRYLVTRVCHVVGPSSSIVGSLSTAPGNYKMQPFSRDFTGPHNDFRLSGSAGAVVQKRICGRQLLTSKKLKG